MVTALAKSRGVDVTPDNDGELSPAAKQWIEANGAQPSTLTGRSLNGQDAQTAKPGVLTGKKL